jgi:hypothetical protein
MLPHTQASHSDHATVHAAAHNWASRSSSALRASCSASGQPSARAKARNSESGIGLELLPEVRDRRAVARWQAEREAHAASDAALNQRLRGRS